MTKRVGYTELDIDKVQSMVDEDISLSEIKKLIDVTSSCIYETKTITSGPIREVEVCPLFLKKDIPDEYRLKRTKQAQKNLNNKNAQKYFIRKVNANFGEKDYYITLGYMNKNLPKDIEEAKKNINKYIKKLNYIYKKNQIKNGVAKNKCETLKYIHVVEFSESGRVHHHMIMNKVLPMETIEETWVHGRRNNIRFLSPDEAHLTGVAKYLSKDPKGKKRWGCSKNLKEPQTTRSISKFSKKKIKNMYDNRNLIELEMERVNPGYKFLDAEIHLNDFNGKIYIYARMRKI
jgi:hypothetical protein